jgi:chorismate dehydratase
MQPRVRIGAVRYLNTKPLIHNLAALAPEADLELDAPSRLADRLAGGQLDVALIPVIEHIRAGTYSVVPNIAIASCGPVLSVTLFSRAPWPEIRRVALDQGSRTSAVLTQVLLHGRHGIRAETVSLPLDADPELIDTDAVLLIGDKAMRACLPGYRFAYDLGDEWFRWTGLPFVFAVWSVREGVDLQGVDAALAAAKVQGIANFGAIAFDESKRLGLDAGFCRRYLENVLRFDLGPTELAGLTDFCNRAHELGLSPPAKSLRFYRPPALATVN